VNDSRQRLDWALHRCKQIQLRMTACRQAILEVLSESRLPVTLEMISEAVGARDRFDPTTIYRSVTLFKAAEVVRCVGTTRKSAYYLLNVPGEHCHFLICRRCGAIKASSCGDHLAGVEAAMARHEGYTAIDHELTFYGICPSCQKAPDSPPTVKLPVPR
jgi:Fe2+ or Zn2+ uptake regulation protein